ncbi:low-temperature-induced 65 kDa protein isoform X2 [Vigna radiata var. radiata]|uniref:Low-temperature-induced 65 kDa protein isoform X2 n=1 Tax=Vigna radiata var. radiata TaxID=3916 RepID=A0A1S3V3J9_VIGRR|nr:low-temperature-induced 65 kDa protein isoform X2 [Vigna radiata var. radiata]
MDSRVVRSEVQENDEHYPHIVPLEQVTHGEEDKHFNHEKKSVLNKVKVKAKKIKDTIKKHGHQVLDRGREYDNEDQHNLDDADLDEDEDTDKGTQVHETPIHESEDVKIVTPTSEQLENLGKSGIDVGDTTVMADESHHDSLPFSTTETGHKIASDPAKVFRMEEKAGLPKDNLERSIGLEEEHYSPGSMPDAYIPPNHQTKVTYPTEEVKEEMETTPVEESFARMNVEEEPKSISELNLQPAIVDSECPRVENHDQPVAHLSAAMQTQYPSSECHEQTISPKVNKNLENVTDSGQTFSTITTAVDEHSCNEANTYKVFSPKDVTASEEGSVEKDNVVTNEEQRKGGDASNMSGSTAQYGKDIAHSLTQKLGPVYDKVAGVGSAVKSKVYGTETKNEVKEQDKGVSVKDYLAEKLRPGEEDKALSELISETLHKRKEETVKNEHHLDGGDDPGKGVVDKLKGVVGSWFGKSEGIGDEHLSKNTNSGAELEQVNPVVGESKE